MAKAAKPLKLPKLKVYCTAVGFYDALVAAPSQKAALKAWGTTTDLFAAGRAIIVEDPAKQELALAHPGEVVKQPRGDEGSILAEIDREEEARPGPRRTSRNETLAYLPVPDRSELDSAERAIVAAKRQLSAQLSVLAEERADLDARESTVRQESETKLKELGRTLERAKAAYERAVRKRPG